MNVINHLNVPATKITPLRQTLKERDHLDRAMVALKHTSPDVESPSVIDYDESLVVKTPPWALLKTTSRLQEAAVVVARDVMVVELDHYDRPEGVAAFASLGDNLELTGLIDEINAYYRALSKRGTCAFTGFELEAINQLVAREISHYLSNMLCLNINVTSCISDKPATALFDYLSEAFPTHHEILVNNQSKIIDKVFSHIAKLADNQEMVKSVLGLLLDNQTCAQSLIDNDEPFVIRARSTSFVYIDLPFEKLNAALPPKQLGVPVVLADDACLLKTIMLNVTARSRETFYRCRTKDGVDFQVSINAIDEDSLLLRGL